MMNKPLILQDYGASNCPFEEIQEYFNSKEECIKWWKEINFQIDCEYAALGLA